MLVVNDRENVETDACSELLNRQLNINNNNKEEEENTVLWRIAVGNRNSFVTGEQTVGNGNATVTREVTVGNRNIGELTVGNRNSSVTGQQSVGNRNTSVSRELTAEVNGNESGSSGESSCSCENCSTRSHYTGDSHEDSMEHNDEPESDNEYTDESEVDVEWRDVEDYECCDDFEIEVGSLGSSHESVENFNNSSDNDNVIYPLSFAVDVDITSSSSSSTGNMSVASDIFYDESDAENYEYSDSPQNNEYHSDLDESDYDEPDEDYDEEGNVEHNDSDVVERLSIDSDDSSRSRSPVLRTPRQERQHHVENTSQDVDAPTTVSKNQPNDRPTSSTEAPESDGTCCICLDDMSTHVVVPCGHICLCQNCCNLLNSNETHRRKKKCPLCKTPFTMVIKVYK